MHTNGTQGVLWQKVLPGMKHKGDSIEGLELVLAAWTCSEVKNKNCKKTWTYHQSKGLPKYVTLTQNERKSWYWVILEQNTTMDAKTAQVLTN
jgi:hypothetical protein